MESGKHFARFVTIVAITVAAAAVGAAPAHAAGAAGTSSSTTVQNTRTVGPYTTWGACDSDRRLYSSRYGYKTYPCELHTNGYYYFKYEPK
jgi:hypothetical protein